ncbi:MAG: class I SAM-dependent methyltransferase [Candidatus Cloacimonadaceae bacterium]|jgi:cyclopropane fatty-acyl-phospholipid synthase-like methyltransferase|nr:class I SAM-dependent methyltransferase [Candidatus Cloacimonadota bacterium]MDX9950011.1 class I SAM-dependent methyltransferase [Candidatus Syntrophosphaera sp.]
MDPREHYRQDALEFDYFEDGKMNPAEQRRTQFTLSICDIRPGMKVLDLGSGRGWFSLEAVKLGAEVTAMDLSEENLARIKDMNPKIETVYGDACELQDLGKKFDLIVALEMMEHLVEPALALQNCREYLKPGGTLLITVPYREEIRYSLCVHCNRKTPVNAHLHSFDQAKMAALLWENGFKVQRSIRFYHKAMAALRLNQLTRKMPFSVWRTLDKLSGLSGDKWFYLAVKARLRN